MSRISASTWAEIRTACASGIGLRQIARNMGIPAGTVLARSKREGWTQQIATAKVITKPKNKGGQPNREVWQAFLKAEKKGRYTASRLKKERPEIYDCVVGLLAPANGGDAMGMDEIAKIFHVDVRTVMAVRDQNPEAIDASRARRISKLLNFADLQIERGLNNPEVVPPNMIALSACQAIDKAELLAGRATQRIETYETIDIQAQYQSLLASVTVNARPALDGAPGPPDGFKLPVNGSNVRELKSLPVEEGPSR